ncbi:uncharacterized protein JCM15063_001848 [Sporobolomyces koalae]|uniref:uncharacterized protein n=1 Tax=Sporobolomyces koalae TaxID=500713 RepID=UPI00316D3708
MTTDHDALSTLTALYPQHSETTLRRYLDASNGNVERAFRAIERGDEIITSKAKRRKVEPRGIEAWINKAETSAASVIVLSDSDDEPDAKPPVPLPAEQRPVKSAFAALRRPQSYPTSAPTSTTIQTNSSATHVNLPPLRLTTPAMIAKETRGLITLVENALPEELASRLFVRMVEASRGTGNGDNSGPWKRNKWYLVDREVESPHTSAFYTERNPPTDEWNTDSSDALGCPQAATHWYNGEFRQSLPFLPEMDEARSLVSAFVNTLLDARERHDLEWKGKWRPNAAAANSYVGAQESVGWHSDQLTHLGPFPTIASLTLGCTRPFRLRPFSPLSLPPSKTSAPTMRTLEITLPHNSLLIMHGGTQEAFKHCVPPVTGMDVFKIPRGTLNAGARTSDEVDALLQTKWRERINMTFRHYRPDFAPVDPSLPLPSTSWLSALPSEDANAGQYRGTPNCSCGKPCILRPDGKGKIRSSTSSAASTGTGSAGHFDSMVFFWSCNAGAQNDGKGCGFFRVLDMKKERRGDWFLRSSNAK